MESDDDFISPNQYRTQQRSNSTMSQTVTSSSANRSAPGRAGPSNPGTSQARPSQLSQENQLSQIQQGMVFLLDSLQQITGSQLEHRAIKRPGEQKPFENKPNIKEECQLCKKLYANKTTLFRHYRAIHKEMNPEKYHGCSLNDTVVSLDASLRDTECNICGYVAVHQTALAQHNRTVHSNQVAAVNANKENINNNAVNVKDKMHKCDDCSCYFEERSKFDEHMKQQHGFEVVCKICNKNFLFKDIDRHVKDSHPDVYNKKDRDEKKEKVIVEKVMRNKKGVKVRVFVCTKCDNTFKDGTEAHKHARNHKKGFKIKAAIAKVFKSDEITDLTSSDDYVIFTCEACDVSSGSYDAAVEHSQNHITNMLQNLTLVTQTCRICDLKFEPLCYKTHVDLHYNNKEIHRETFKYFKYKFQLLLTDNWVNSFNMDDELMKNIMVKSIYAKTRSVKMRVLHEGEGNILYKCCQCDNFVDPAAVVNHTLNYDTCVKVKSSYGCDICKRKFNNRLTRDRHARYHNSGDNFKIVLFNNDQDKEFNKILNDPNISVNHATIPLNEGENGGGNDHAKVIYKCLCGLCFVRKESADVHRKICPGKDPKKSCPKCNNFFNPEELLAHCFEHHLVETKITIENITPDVIEIESDDEENENKTVEKPGNENNEMELENGNITVIEIDSSDEDDQENHGLRNINMEVVKSENVNSNTDETNNEERNNTAQAQTFGSIVDQNLAQVDRLATENRVINENEELDSQLMYGEVDHDDSEDTDLETDACDPNPAKWNKIKCVDPNQLLNPCHMENYYLNREDVHVLNREIDSVRRQIETVENSHIELFNNITIKEEKPWLFDPTNFSNICGRRSFRQREIVSTSGTSHQLFLESLLTDDEEDEDMGSSVMPELNSRNNLNSVSPPIEQNRNTGEPYETVILHREDAPDEHLNSAERAVDNNRYTIETIVENEDHIQPELTENCIDKDLNAQTNKDGNVVNKDCTLLNSNMENYEDVDDDDLFLPSGKPNNVSYNPELNNHETDRSKDIQNTTATNKEVRKDLIGKESLNTNTIAMAESENVNMENVPMNGMEICNGMQNSSSSEREDNSVYLDIGEGDNDDDLLTERDVIQCVADENTRGYEETDPKNTPINGVINEDEDTFDYEQTNAQKNVTNGTNNNNNDTMNSKPAGNESASKNPNCVIEFEKSVKKIKTELISRYEHENEIDCEYCDKDSLVEVKTEPYDRSDIDFDPSELVNDIDKKCCIV